MRVALVQIAASTDPQENLAVLAVRTAEAAASGARLVVFPEATMSRFGGVPLRGIAEPLDGPWATGVREVAVRHGVTVVAGMFTPGEGERVRNTLLVAGPTPGEPVTSYDKIHLFDAFGYRESDDVTPGDAPVLVDVDGVRFGLATCYDLRFASLFQRLADDGASVVLLPASWGSGPGKLDQWQLLCRARALDSTCYVLACDQADPTTAGMAHGPGPTGIGASTAVEPDGRVVDALGAAPGVLLVDLDLDAVARARRTIPVLANRRV